MHGNSTRIAARGLAGALLLGAGLLVAASDANAQCPTTRGQYQTVAELYAAGYLWDIQSNGAIEDGTNNAFDFGFSLMVDGEYFPPDTTPTSELSGRQYALGPATMSGLQVTRRVYVPDALPSWARFLEYLHNPSNQPIAASVEIQTNVGSDSGTIIAGSSDWDSDLETTDLWAITNPYDHSTQGVTHVIDWPGGADPSAVSTTVFSCSGTEGVMFRYDIVVPAGGTSILMHAGGQGYIALDWLDDLAAMPAGLLSGVPTDDYPLIVNADSDPDQDGVRAYLDNCPHVANADQEDMDSDGLGDVCDNCPSMPNPDQVDYNENGIGSACDPESPARRCGMPGDVASLLAVAFLPLLARRRRGPRAT